MMYLFLIIGFALLIKGSQLVVAGSSALGKHAKISPLVISITLLALGTSFPEFFVSIIASARGYGGIAYGTAIGSSIANVLLIIGLSAACTPLFVTSRTVKREIPFAILSVLVLLFLASDFSFGTSFTNTLSRGDGFVLVTFFLGFLYYLYTAYQKSETDSAIHEPDIKTRTVVHALFLTAGGLVLIVLGGSWVVTNIVKLTSVFGISQTLAGLTIVAFATSLPELIAAGTAAYKKKTDVAIGTVISANIFTILASLGVASIVQPIVLVSGTIFDGIILLAITFVLLLFLFVGKRHYIDRWQGIAFIGLYVLYIASLFLGRF